MKGKRPGRRTVTLRNSRAFRWTINWAILAVALAGLVGSCLAQTAESLARVPDTSLEQEVSVLFQQGRYKETLRRIRSAPPEQRLTGTLLRIGVLSHLRLGQLEPALTLYAQYYPPGHSDDRALLRQIGMGILTSRIRGPQESLRVIAFTELAESGRREVVPLLEDGLLDSSALVRAKAAESLGWVGVGAYSPALSHALKDPVPSVRIAALNAVAERKDHRMLEAVTDIAHSEEGPVQVFALAALIQLGKESALAELLDATTLPDPEIRMAAVGALGRLRHPSILKTLSQAVYDPHPSVRAFAAGALGEFGNPAGASALMQGVVDDSPEVRALAAASLGRLGLASARSLLWQTIQDPDPLVRAGALEGLLRLGDGKAMLVAMDLAKHPDPSVRGAVARAMGRAGYARGLSLIEQLTRDPHPQPRLEAMRALGKMDDSTVLSLLKQGLQDSEPSVRLAAAGSLVQALGHRKAVGERAR